MIDYDEFNSIKKFNIELMKLIYCTYCKYVFVLRYCNNDVKL